MHNTSVSSGEVLNGLSSHSPEEDKVLENMELAERAAILRWDACARPLGGSGSRKESERIQQELGIHFDGSGNFEGGLHMHELHDRNFEYGRFGGRVGQYFQKQRAAMRGAMTHISPEENAANHVGLDGRTVEQPELSQLDEYRLKHLAIAKGATTQKSAKPKRELPPDPPTKLQIILEALGSLVDPRAWKDRIADFFDDGMDEWR